MHAVGISAAALETWRSHVTLKNETPIETMQTQPPQTPNASSIRQVLRNVVWISSFPWTTGKVHSKLIAIKMEKATETRCMIRVA